MSSPDVIAQVPSGRSLGWSLSVRSRRVLILGTGRMATDLCEELAKSRKGVLAFEVAGFINSESERIEENLANSKVIGTFDQLYEIAIRNQIQIIAVCLEDRRSQLPVQALLDLKTNGIEVVEGYRLYEEVSQRLSIDVLKPSALIFSTGFQRRLVTMALKRMVDLVFSLGGLVFLSPLFVVIAILVKADSPGPVFYRQIRVGLRGQPYLMWKFRSMTKDAEKAGPRWADAHDPRISRVGRWLRKLRLDELPQFINVLRGEMSLVGPRPERPMFVQELRGRIPYYDIRHTIRPGITGWAQTKFRYGSSVEDAHTKLQYDLYYVKNMSFSLDCRIIAETVRVVLLSEGAR